MKAGDEEKFEGGRCSAFAYAYEVLAPCINWGIKRQMWYKASFDGIIGAAYIHLFSITEYWNIFEVMSGRILREKKKRAFISHTGCELFWTTLWKGVGLVRCSL